MLPRRREHDGVAAHGDRAERSANVAPYRWYGADATAAIRPGESGTLIRLRAGPSSNALAVNRVEICFDTR